MSPRQNWDSPTPFLASECAPPPGTKGGAHSPAGEGLGESRLRRLEKSLTLGLLCALHLLPLELGRLARLERLLQGPLLRSQPPRKQLHDLVVSEPVNVLLEWVRSKKGSWVNVHGLSQHRHLYWQKYWKKKGRGFAHWGPTAALIETLLMLHQRRLMLCVHAGTTWSEAMRSLSQRMARYFIWIRKKSQSVQNF